MTSRSLTAEALTAETPKPMLANRPRTPQRPSNRYSRAFARLSTTTASAATVAQRLVAAYRWWPTRRWKSSRNASELAYPREPCRRKARYPRQTSPRFPPGLTRGGPSATDTSIPRSCENQRRARPVSRGERPFLCTVDSDFRTPRFQAYADTEWRRGCCLARTCTRQAARTRGQTPRAEPFRSAASPGTSGTSLC